MTVPDHRLHPAPCLDYGHVTSGLLQLLACKPTSKHHSASPVDTECSCLACVQPPKMFPCHPHAEVTPLSAVTARIRFKFLSLAYTAANRTYLQNLIQCYDPARHLHSSTEGCLAPPPCCVNGSRSSQLWSFSTLTPQWWNNLPMRSAPSLPVFCRGLKTHLFRLYLD